MVAGLILSKCNTLLELVTSIPHADHRPERWRYPRKQPDRLTELLKALKKSPRLLDKPRYLLFRNINLDKEAPKNQMTHEKRTELNILIFISMSNEKTPAFFACEIATPFTVLILE